MSAFERFLAGEDRLAGLLQALPAYVPSAEFEAAFTAAARAAQLAHPVGAASSRELAQTMPLRNKSETDATISTLTLNPSPLKGEGSVERREAAASGFEPPTSLEANFLKMAAHIDAAQAPRRDALLADIAKGTSPEAAIGAVLQPATAEWLQNQASEAAPAKAAKPARKPGWLGFSWFDLRLAGLATILAAVGVQLVLKFQPTPHEIAVQEVFQNALQTQAPSNKEELAQAAEHSLVEAKIALDRAQAANEAQQKDKAKQETRRLDSSQARNPLTPPAPLDRGETDGALLPPLGAMPSQAPSPVKGKAGEGLALSSEARTPHPTASAEPRADSLSGQPALSASPIAPVQAGSLEKSIASASPAMRGEADMPERRERAIGEIALTDSKESERAQAAPAKKLNLAPTMAPAPAPAAAPAEAKAPVASRVAPAMARPAPAPIMAAAPAPAREATNKPDVLRESIRARLSDAPADVAARLPLRPAGQSWTVYSATPEHSELRAWVEALRKSIPAKHRPDHFLIIREDGPPDALRIMPPPLAP